MLKHIYIKWNQPTLRALSCVALMASLITGCGRGGSSSTGTSSGSAGGNTGGSSGGAADPNALQSSAPLAHYPNAFDNTVFASLNQARVAYGVGYVSQSAALDKAVAAHLAWQNQNNYYGHNESAGTPGFTGVTFSDRDTAAGYTGLGGSEVLQTLYPGPTDTPVTEATKAVPSWLNSVYHRFAVLGPYRDMGTANAAFNVANPPGISATTMGVDFGIPANSQPQYPTAAWIGVWPLPNSTAEAVGFQNEDPSPAPDLPPATCFGEPVTVEVSRNQTLTVTSFTLTEIATGAAVTTRLLTAASDPSHELGNGQAALLPMATLMAGASYTASFSGTVNGVPVSKNWSFTTPSGGNTLANCN